MTGYIVITQSFNSSTWKTGESKFSVGSMSAGLHSKTVLSRIFQRINKNMRKVLLELITNFNKFREHKFNMEMSNEFLNTSKQ